MPVTTRVVQVISRKDLDRFATNQESSETIRQAPWWTADSWAACPPVGSAQLVLIRLINEAKSGRRFGNTGMKI